MATLKLRSMIMGDADRMLVWKNYPETRQFSIVSHDEITKEDHYRWLENNLQHFSIIELIGEMGDRAAIGAIRIKEMEISIWIDREFWTMGTATEVLRLVAKPTMTAKIVNGNVGSLRAFINAGFMPVDYKDTYYIMERS